MEGQQGQVDLSDPILTALPFLVYVAREMLCCERSKRMLPRLEELPVYRTH